MRLAGTTQLSDQKVKSERDGVDATEQRRASRALSGFSTGVEIPVREHGNGKRVRQL